MWFYTVYLAIVGLILVVLCIRIIALLVSSKKGPHSFLLDLAETRELLRLVESARHELKNAHQAVRNTIVRCEQRWRPVTGFEQHKEQKKFVHINYPFKVYSKGKDSTIYKISYSSDKVLDISVRPDVCDEDTMHDYVKDVLNAWKDVHEAYYYPEKSEKGYSIDTA